MAAWGAALRAPDGTPRAPARPKGPNMRSLGNQRRFLVQRIRRMLEPHMWDSGYRTPIDPSKGLLAGSRALRLWIPKGPDGKPLNDTWRIGGYVVDEIEGATENGPITDSHCAIVVTDWDCMPIEDLVRMQAWLEKNLPDSAGMAKAA